MVGRISKVALHPNMTRKYDEVLLYCVIWHS